MQRLMYHDASGNLCIVIPAPGTGLSLAEIAQKDIPTGRTFVAVDEANVPTDRTYRNAWKGDMLAGTIAVDMVKARAIHRDAIRAARVAALAALDTAVMRANEIPDSAEVQRLVARKQALRDFPADPRIDAATTVDALRVIWHADLGPNPMERRDPAANDPTF